MTRSDHRIPHRADLPAPYEGEPKPEFFEPVVRLATVFKEGHGLPPDLQSFMLAYPEVDKVIHKWEMAGQAREWLRTHHETDLLQELDKLLGKKGFKEFTAALIEMRKQMHATKHQERAGKQHRATEIDLNYIKEKEAAEARRVAQEQQAAVDEDKKRRMAEYEQKRKAEEERRRAEEALAIDSEETRTRTKVEAEKGQAGDYVLSIIARFQQARDPKHFAELLKEKFVGYSESGPGASSSINVDSLFAACNAIKLFVQNGYMPQLIGDRQVYEAVKSHRESLQNYLNKAVKLWAEEGKKIPTGFTLFG